MSAESQVRSGLGLQGVAGGQDAGGDVRFPAPRRGVYVSMARVLELLARAEAGLPRDRQAPDAARRAASGVACAVAEAALAAELPGGRPLWTVAVPEDVPGLVECTGLPPRDVRGGLALLEEAGVVERVVARGGARVRLAEEVVAAAPILARVVWPALRAALGEQGTSVAPALAVVRAVAARTAGVRADGAGDPVAVTQQELSATTLFGRTAVVAALRGLEQLGALELAARRGTWTECRLRPPVFGEAAFTAPRLGFAHLPAPSPAPLPGVAPELGAVRDVDRPPDATDLAVRTSHLPLAPSWQGTPAGQLVASETAPVEVAAAARPLSLDVAGVVVPLQPGMSVQPPPGAQLVVEIDPDGRRYLRIDAAIRVGPLP